MLQVVETKCGTIKESIGELHGTKVAHRISMTHRSCSHIRDCATMQIGWKVTIGVTFHDKMVNLRQQGVDGRKLKQRFEMICLQYSINELEKGGTVEFEFQHAYKSQMIIH